jgi:hypothetical protein
MKRQTDSSLLRAALPWAMALFVVGCERPEVPLPIIPSSAATPSPAPVAERMVATQLVPAPISTPYTAWSTCNMEHVDGQAFSSKPSSVKAGKDFAIDGYAFIEGRQSVPTDIKLRVLSTGSALAWEADIKGRVNRPDIPQYFKLGPWAAGAGIEQLFSSSALAPGTYHLLFTASDGGGKLICDNGRQIEISP